VPEETARRNSSQIASANASRLSESLRVVEEAFKCESAELAARAEKIRYASYNVAAALIRQFDVRPRLENARLCVIVTEAHASGGAIVAARRAIEGGAEMIQMREKEMRDAPFLELAKKLREATRDAGALFIVNDRVHVAAAAGADGAHLGADDLPVAAARKILGPDAIIGASAHSLDEARRAVESGADYLGVGPAFPTATKSHEKVRGLDYIREAILEAGIPCFAIGGITPLNVAEVVAAGASRIAVCAGVISAADVAAAAREIRSKLPENRPEKET
jgi:thiamine-phosphate pyrophosphorylase